VIKTDNKGNIVACITTKEDLDYTNFDLETIDYYDNFLIPSYEQEIERLHFIIKEVREKLKELVEDDGTFIGEIDYLRKKELLEILDKENKND